MQERVMLAYGPDAGPGTLTLSPSQLVFVADSGRVLTLERLDIVGASQTRDLPDRTVARPVLVVSTPTETWFFAVRAPSDWLHLLT